MLQIFSATLLPNIVKFGQHLIKLFAKINRVPFLWFTVHINVSLDHIDNVELIADLLIVILSLFVLSSTHMDGE